MSNTRHAKTGTPFRQERYASSEEFERGLNGYLVARRCGVLDKAEDRELIYFLQLLSHREGGLEKVATAIVAENSGNLGTPSMFKFGRRAGQRYNADQVKAIRGELPLNLRETFLLKGESTFLDTILESDSLTPAEYRRMATQAMYERDEQDEEKLAAHPAGYPYESFAALFNEGFSVANVEKYLNDLCLDPAEKLEDGPWYFSDLIKAFRRYQSDWIKARLAETVVTDLGAKLGAALDFALQTRCMVLVEGKARMGKSVSAKAWAEQHPGQARYVQLEANSDEGGFFRAIAKSLGLATGLSWKAAQLRDRVQETLQAGHLILILDEAHYCWPISNSRFAFPHRIAWIMTALVNHKVPVALISTPQFIRTQKVMEARTQWNSDQFTGRIGHYEQLPDSLSESDLEKVARALLPEGDAKSIETLVCYAQGSAKYLAGIEAIVRRARYLALKDRRDAVKFADIKRAAQESVIPSDSALAHALAVPIKSRRRTVSTPINEPLIDTEDALNEQQNGPRRTTNFADKKPAETLNRSGQTPLRETHDLLTA